MKTLKLLENGIEIKVNNADDMFLMFWHFHLDFTIAIENEIFKKDKIIYTRSYFNRFFN